MATATSQTFDIIDSATLEALEKAYHFTIPNQEDLTDMDKRIKNVKNLYDIDMSYYTDEYGDFQRPTEWPEIKLENISDQEVYLLYDNTRDHMDEPFCGVTAKTQSNAVWWVDLGHASPSGKFVRDEILSQQASGTAFQRWFSESDGDYPIIRIRTDGKFSEINTYQSPYLVDDETTTTEYYGRHLQPLIEVRARSDSATRIFLDNRLKWLVNFIFYKCTALNVIYYQFNECHNLEHYEFVESPLNVGSSFSLDCLFYSCYRVRKLDINFIEPNDKFINDFDEMFDACYSLSEIDCSDWDWSKIDSNYFWKTNSCYSLQKVNYDDILKQKITTNKKYCLQTQYNYNLRDTIDMSGITAEDWVPYSTNTNIAYFYNNYCLKGINLSNMDLSNFTKVYLAEMLYFNESNKFIDMTNFPVEKLSSVNAAFRDNYSLETVDFTGCDFSNITMTDIRTWFYNDWSLSSIDLSTFDDTNCTFTNYSSTFNYLYSLRDISLSKIRFDVSFTESYNLTKTSIMNIINALQDTGTSHTLRLHFCSLNILTPDDIAIATNKGWNITT